MFKSKIDVAVLLLFFARPEQTAKVFEQIRKARPSRLFLYQDGPRGERDLNGIESCRKIVEDIDWECDVHKYYQENNLGCDPSEYISQKWMFSFVDKGIVLEDDDVPSQSFFPFCKELLDKYEHDTRIGMICGQCHLESVDVGADYFFSSRGPIWGWASWKRVIDTWDPDYKWLDNDIVLEQLKKSKLLTQKRINDSISKRATGKAHYEDFSSITRILYNQLAIIPAKNLISNIGISNEGTHYGNSLLDLPPKNRRLLYMKVYDLDFPLKHPEYIYENKYLTQKILFTVTYTWKERLYNLCRRIYKFIVRVNPLK